MGDGAGAGGEAACCPASGAGVEAGGATGAGAGGAAASFAAGGAGEGGGEGAAFCAVGAGADDGAGSLATGAGAGGTGVTVAGPGETGGVTFVWLLAVQKTAAIATRTTPPSKAHNQRDMAFPSRRLELSPMMGDPHPSVESVGRAARCSPSSIYHGAHMTPLRASLDARSQKPTSVLALAWRPAPFGGSPAPPKRARVKPNQRGRFRYSLHRPKWPSRCAVPAARSLPRAVSSVSDRVRFHLVGDNCQRWVRRPAARELPAV